RPRGLKVHMLTDVVPNQTLLAQRIAAESPRHGLEVELSNRPVGTLEALDLVDSPNPIDHALVAAGVGRRDYPNVRQMTALAAMPIHLVTRAELAVGGLSRLRGRRISLGLPTMATHAIARDLLDFAGFRAPVAGRS